MPAAAAQQQRTRASGTLSYQASGVAHDMQAEPGLTIERPQRDPRRDDVQEASDREPGNQRDGRETHVHGVLR